VKNDLSVEIGRFEGRTFIIGRDGHIYIDSLQVSKLHAEIKITNGKIFLRDLDSTNGTYLVKNNKLVYFEQGFVNLLQPIVIGDAKHTVHSLLAIVGVFIEPDNETEDNTTLTYPVKMTANGSG
jgi:pSer/pThr/pTyr-binding forkhead associated (FHA) protein